MANQTRTISKNAAIGVALLALSGSLLAVDVGATRAVQPELAPAPAQAVAVAAAATVAPARAAVAPAPARPACALPASHSRPGGITHPIAGPHRSAPHLTLAALIVRHVERRNDRPRARLRAAPHAIVAHAAIRERGPVRIARIVAVRGAPRAESRPAPAVAPHPSGKPGRAKRSAVEAAQYFAVRTVEAQTPGVEHVAAVTRKRGSSRLVVHLIAKTRGGTLVEYEVIRRNGIGFAIESRTTRFVALSTRPKAATRTSSGQDTRKGR